MQVKRVLQGTLGAIAMATVFSVSAQTSEGSRANPPTPSPPTTATPNADAQNTTGGTHDRGMNHQTTTNTGNVGTDPAMTPGAPAGPGATPGAATPGTAGTQSGSTAVNPTKPGAAAEPTTRSN
ncbi:hypothetical protein IMZ29_00130 [Achromobacter sp. GG226]|uniref:hypothetical protein n=1 Tax=Verticiella alkaliphila TaxID=2779529 RepID=UPI001C0AD60C|nr:hypothetical protein [Verticiella sp. GG226]MBU4609015.1 hypothetical protein [Verticiella sp. GG226]